MKGGRKSSRKATRKNRKVSRRSSRRAPRQRGGWIVLNPAELTNTSMADAGKQSLAQGGEYKQLHMGQYGGAPLVGAPVGETGVLDSSLRTAAMVGPLDRSLTAISGMSDQSGGARKGRKTSRKGRKTSRKGRKTSRKGRKGRRTSGGALNPADYSAPGTLLPTDLQSKALATMNPEWKLAENPASFAPKA